MEKPRLRSRQALVDGLAFACIALPLAWLTYLAFIVWDCRGFWSLPWSGLSIPAAWRQTGGFGNAIAFGLLGFVGRIPFYAIGVIGLSALARGFARVGVRSTDLLTRGWLRSVERRPFNRRRDSQSRLWIYVGELTDIRHHRERGFLRVKWFAEVRTTHETFIVKGRVHENDSCPGLPVSKNGLRQIRIGGLVGTVFKLET